MVIEGAGGLAAQFHGQIEYLEEIRAAVIEKAVGVQRREFAVRHMPAEFGFQPLHDGYSPRQRLFTLVFVRTLNSWISS